MRWKPWDTTRDLKDELQPANIQVPTALHGTEACIVDRTHTVESWNGPWVLSKDASDTQEHQCCHSCSVWSNPVVSRLYPPNMSLKVHVDSNERKPSQRKRWNKSRVRVVQKSLSLKLSSNDKTSVWRSTDERRRLVHLCEKVFNVNQLFYENKYRI